MFRRRVTVEAVGSGDPDGSESSVRPCTLASIDNFAMRNFTNDAVFDDTLPVDDGLLEIGNRVPLDLLQISMEAWFRRKGYLKANERLRIAEPS